jgi:hypothetical protein
VLWAAYSNPAPSKKSNQGEDESFPNCTADALFNRLFLLLRNAHGLDYTPWANTRYQNANLSGWRMSPIGNTTPNS